LGQFARPRSCAATPSGVSAVRGAFDVRKWVLLLGLAAVFAALVIAGAEALLADRPVRANAKLGGGVYTIPLAAAISL
jgi:hypothetical protein